MHYYKIGRTGEQIILSTQINYRDIVQLGNILGIKIGNRIYYRLYGEFWYKDVNTNKDYPVDFLNNIIEDEAVGFFDDYIAVEDIPSRNPELFLCKLYDYSGNVIKQNTSLQVYSQARKVMLNLLVDCRKYGDYYDSIGVKWQDRPSYMETFYDDNKNEKINYEVVSDLINYIKSKGMIAERAAELLMEYSEIFLLYGYEDFSVPFVNIMSLPGIPLNQGALIIRDKNPLCDKMLFERIKYMVENCDEKEVSEAFLDFAKLKKLYNNLFCD